MRFFAFFVVLLAIASPDAFAACPPGFVEYDIAGGGTGCTFSGSAPTDQVTAFLVSFGLGLGLGLTAGGIASVLASLKDTLNGF